MVGHRFFGPLLSVIAEIGGSGEADDHSAKSIGMLLHCRSGLAWKIATLGITAVAVQPECDWKWTFAFGGDEDKWLGLFSLSGGKKKEKGCGGNNTKKLINHLEVYFC